MEINFLIFILSSLVFTFCLFSDICIAVIFIILYCLSLYMDIQKNCNVKNLLNIICPTRIFLIFFILPHISYYFNRKYMNILNPLLPGNIKDQGYGFTPFQTIPLVFLHFLIFKNVDTFLLQDTHHTIHDILLLRIFSSNMSPFSAKTEQERSLFQLPNHCF